MISLSDADETRCPAGAGREPGGCRAAAKVKSYKKSPAQARPARGMIPDLGNYLILATLKRSLPAGACTSTSSPTRWSSSACPSGNSFEISPCLGLASAAPTMV